MTRLAELRVLTERSPEGPWSARPGHNEAADGWDVVDANGHVVCEWCSRDEAMLIAAMRNALPMLLDCVQALEKIAEDASYADSVAAGCLGQIAEEALAKLSDSMVPNVIGGEK